MLHFTIEQVNDAPVILRLRFYVRGIEEERLAIGFITGNTSNRLQVHGNGYIMIVKSDSVDNSGVRVRVFSCVEVWGLSVDGKLWVLILNVPHEFLIETLSVHYWL